MASNPKIEYQVFLCIFQKNSAMMATLGLKEMGKFLLGRWGKRSALSQFSFASFPQKPVVKTLL